MSTLQDIPGIGPALRGGLETLGITDVAALASADVARLTQLRGISQMRAEAFIAAARAIVLPVTSNDSTDARNLRSDKAASKKDKKSKKKASEAKVKAKNKGKKSSGAKERKSKPGEKKKGRGSGKKKGR